MKISEHIINEENGTEYFKIYFEVYDIKDISLKKYKEIQLEIEKLLLKK
jgi:hypothetical protein